MPLVMDYAQPLRAIGQALETLQMENFAVEPEGEDFVVRGAVAARAGAAQAGETEERSLHFSRERGGDSKASEAAPSAAAQFDLCYTLKDVDRLDQSGRTRRGNTGGSAAPGLSQLLRTIGTYLDEKPARLVKISKQGESLTIVYETFSGIIFEEKLALGDLRDLGAEMSMRRGKRELQ